MRASSGGSNNSADHGALDPATSQEKRSIREPREGIRGEAWSEHKPHKLPNTVIIPDLHSSFRTQLTQTSNSTGRASMSNNFGSIPLQPGEYIHGDEHDRPLSAPPTPSFRSGNEGRVKHMDELLWGSSVPMVKDDFFLNHFNGSNGGTTSFSMGGMLTGGIPPRRMESEGDRTSFTNLADVLGTDLVESMEDAMQDRLNNTTYSAKNDPLSFHRMKRHAASRLMGQSPPPTRGDEAANMEKNGSTQRPPSHEIPWTLSVPHSDRAEQAEKEQIARRSTTPVQMFPGQQSSGQRRSHAVSHDIGMNVQEPEGENQFSRIAGIVSQRIDHQHPNIPSDPTIGSDSNRSMHELERGVKNMWSPEAREFKPASMVDASNGGRSVNSSTSDKTEVTSRQAENDLQPYLWRTDSNQASRSLAILHVSWLRVPDIRTACERFGVLESFRADFASRGIFFLSYYDIRSAQYAAAELHSILQRLSVMQGSNEEVVVRYCLSLSSSSQFDESRIVISNLPHSINEYALKSILSSYGALLSVMYQEDGSYIAEFQNLQDTKQALLELDSAQPWGPDVLVEVSVRNGMERKRGRELLALIGRWRHGMVRVDQGPGGNDPQQYHRDDAHGRVGDPWGRDTAPQFQAHPMDQRQQYVLGPDGRFTPLVHNHHPAGGGFDPSRQQLVQGANGQMYITAIQHPDAHAYAAQRGSHHPSSGGASYDRRMQQNHTPYYAHVITSDANSLSGRSLRSGHSQGTEGGEKDNRHLMMDLDMVEIGHDTRTSLMVRNIPNKYTQQMLLSEFEANGHGPGVIDFFYLPIDFKNRCNRGYAFVNFVEPMAIVAFHRRYYGKHWRTFNSDKICDITYARIQGKDAMLKRFENSALMEKDDEYKPLVFASDGPTKGTRLPFPDPSLHSNRVGRTEV